MELELRESESAWSPLGVRIRSFPQTVMKFSSELNEITYNNI
jgi:hypothetical protein